MIVDLAARNFVMRDVTKVAERTHSLSSDSHAPVPARHLATPYTPRPPLRPRVHPVPSARMLESLLHRHGDRGGRARHAL